MSVRVVVVAPFRQRGVCRMNESEFVVALSLDRDWFSPDQAKRFIDVAAGQGLLSREDGAVSPGFDPETVEVPEGFVPDEDVLRRRSPFEQTLDALVEAGHEKREAVASINGLQRELAVSVEAAAVVYARRQGVDVADIADQALATLAEE